MLVIDIPELETMLRDVAAPPLSAAVGSPDVRISRRGCPFRAGRRVAPSNSLAVRAPDVACQWHPIKNATLTPREVTCGSRRLVWWQCDRIQEHHWRSPILNRARDHVRQGSGRPIRFRADRAQGIR